MWQLLFCLAYFCFAEANQGQHTHTHTHKQSTQARRQPDKQANRQRGWQKRNLHCYSIMPFPAEERKADTHWSAHVGLDVPLSFSTVRSLSLGCRTPSSESSDPSGRWAEATADRFATCASKQLFSHGKTRTRANHNKITESSRVIAGLSPGEIKYRTNNWIWLSESKDVCVSQGFCGIGAIFFYLHEGPKKQGWEETVNWSLKP